VPFSAISSGTVNDPLHEWSGDTGVPIGSYSGSNQWTAAQDGWRIFLAQLDMQYGFIGTNATVSGKYRFHLSNTAGTSGQDFNSIYYTDIDKTGGSPVWTVNLGMDRFFNSGETVQVWFDYYDTLFPNPPQLGTQLIWHTHQSGNAVNTTTTMFPM